MKRLFSQRIGVTKPKSLVQIDSMDEELRTAIWNMLVRHVWSRLKDMENLILSPIYPYYQAFTNIIWTDFLKLRLDQAPPPYVFHKFMELNFFKWEWHKVYDFIDFITQNFPEEYMTREFTEDCNFVLERELSAFRFVGKHLMPNITKEEMKEVEEALDISKYYTEHLDRALEMLADRKTPDYRNSIKESISAVEATCQLITGNSKASLGDALKKLNSNAEILHPALKEALSRLYGYASDAEGIRHALQGKSNLDATDAKFMLIICSAFVNYLVSQASKVGIDLKASK